MTTKIFLICTLLTLSGCQLFTSKLNEKPIEISGDTPPIDLINDNISVTDFSAIVIERSYKPAGVDTFLITSDVVRVLKGESIKQVSYVIRYDPNLTPEITGKPMIVSLCKSTTKPNAHYIPDVGFRFLAKDWKTWPLKTEQSKIKDSYCDLKP
ncbi:hypothetical protein H0A36_26650 [Endozoicomonas sp. SM1973]|uniref:Lipoprotein n=1 Tax=Spartinivicinus marinus TaxID=2994442 RepID=A0A853I9M8_9GAMM|nr:hypothetical protein [Spartinivicinus marinus]NYZ69599.1 hypothetical protein [Spartinivicinus marinus]